MRILVLNGPNLNLLGQREPEVYGRDTLQDLERHLRRQAQQLGAELEFQQSNQEGYLIDALHRASRRCVAVIFNPGGYAHTSVALHDAIAGISVPVIEVHISNIHARESFRHTSITAGACVGQINGLGLLGYEMALEAIVRNEKLKGGEAPKAAEPRGRDQREAREAREEKDDDDSRDSSRRRRGRRGGRGRRRRSDGENEGNETSENQEKEEPRTPGLAERYASEPDVTIRKGIDILDEDEPEIVSAHGSVTFVDDEGSDAAASSGGGRSSKKDDDFEIAKAPKPAAPKEEKKEKEEKPETPRRVIRKVATRRKSTVHKSEEAPAEKKTEAKAQESKEAPEKTEEAPKAVPAKKKTAKKAAKKKTAKKAVAKTSRKKAAKKSASKSSKSSGDKESGDS